MKKIEFALESFRNIHDLIKFTDQKASAVLVLAGLVITVFLKLSENLYFVSPSKSSIVQFFAFVAGAITILGLTYVICLITLKVLKARLAENYNQNELSIFYFEHINQIDKLEMTEKYKSLKKDEMLTYVLDQQSEVSRVLCSKIRFLNQSLIVMLLSIVMLLVFIVLTRLI